MTVRVRFAPSPTGNLTVGGLRSSLFNYLFARHHGGSFILRIEDTDRRRIVPGSLDALLAAHRWLGLDWDEGPDAGGAYGPYFQSERLGIYHAAAERLLAAGSAYRCYCTEQRLDDLRAEQRRRGQPTGYDRRCRFLDADERARHEAGGTPFVVRFAMPTEGETTLDDPIRGVITWKNTNYDDHVLVKSDGFPTYGLAAIVDDVEMRITHAFRAEEWLPSTPRHLQTFYALGVQPPQYGHLPVIVGKDRKKLSKRHGDNSVTAYEDMGYLPDAMFNFLGLIGWSLDDKTVIVSRQQFAEAFTIDRIVRSPALFDLDKLNWLNQEYIKAMADDAFARLAGTWLEQGLPPTVPRPLDSGCVAAIAPELKTRVKRMDEAASLTAYLFAEEPLTYPASLFLGPKGNLDPAEQARLLRIMRDALAAQDDWSEAGLNEFLRSFGEQQKANGLSLGKLLAPVRTAISGTTVSLPMHTSLAVLGKTRSLRRLDDGLEKLPASAAAAAG